MKLFVYGTLRPGHAPRKLASLVATMRSLGAAHVRGRLYDLGDYPGAMIEAAAPGFVRGELLESDDDAVELLVTLDAYEGSTFRRERATAESTNGSRHDCWIYVLVNEPAAERVIASGAWEPRD